MFPSWWQILLVILLIVLLFGKGKIADFMGDFAKGIKSFKKGLADDDAPADAAKKTIPRDSEAQSSTSQDKVAKG